ncbi:amidohydrolase family protein [Bacillus sp. J33]|uniref:amidohydrolase family protein n=1 Tax=Bacillus sp. J33 TaxID=935836 RepID=UPI0004AE8566|nr:amidohydrolase family protein [Bacillus sp. J33]
MNKICGHPQCDFSIEEYRNTIKNFPMDISFAATSISIGFENLAHFTSITKSQALNKQDLINPLIIKKLAEKSDYPGENIFINATPANFTEKQVPRAGELIYTKDELEKIAETYHNLGKKIGAHVAGEPGIELALNAGIDVLHHAHGITKKQIEKAANQEVHVVATPMGGTHLLPNFPEEILKLVQHNIPVSISTDAYLPPHPEATWLPFKDHTLKGPDSLMAIARPSMKLLQQNGYEENEILALLTANPASLLGRENHFGKLELGYDANFLVAEGIPGLDITRLESVKKVYFRGKEVINRMYS